MVVKTPMTSLVSQLTVDLIESMYAEVASAKRVVAIYSGRFQPPGLHHFETYKWLVDQFGKNNVFIATSDIIKFPDNPLPFTVKAQVWKKYGAPTNHIVQVKNPYIATEIVSTLSKNDVVVFAFGEKDSNRFAVGKKKDGSASYLQSYEANKDNLESQSKHAYVLTTPHVSLKAGDKEMSGTQIRTILSQPHDEKIFKSIFGWYDPKIDNVLSSRFKNVVTPINEGGNTFEENVTKIKRENLDSTIAYTLELYGLDTLPYSKIGNHQKPIANDVDIAIDSEELSKFFGVDSSKESIFQGAKAYFDKIHAPHSYVLNPSLNQIILLGMAMTPQGKPQEFIGDAPPNTKPLVQIDIMLGNRKWREKLYSGAPESDYKAKYRNLFIYEIFAQLIEDEGSVEGVKQKYLLNPGDGFYLQKFTVNPKGKRVELSRELKSTDMDFVAKFLFGQDKSFKDIDTFEKVYALFKSDDFRFPDIRSEVVTAYKSNLSKHKELPHPTLKEDRNSIQRFMGTGEMNNTAFLKFLKKLQPLVKAGKLNLEVNNNVSVTEKLDGSACKFGINRNKRFFMESANSGEVTIDQADKFNNPYSIHFYQSLQFLNTYKPFQTRLQKAFSLFGAFKVTSEMFAVLTHKGDEFGDIVFVATKYNKSKLGDKGSFVCLEAESEKSSPSEDIMDQISDTKDQEWKVYNINRDGGLPRQNLVFDLSGVKDLIDDPKKIDAAISLLRKRKTSPERDALQKVIFSVKKQLQGTLDKYAENINSFLGSADRKYPVEGVVLKVHLPDEDIFFKGTSEVFKQIKAKTWGTRANLSSIEKVLDGEFLTSVFEFNTSHGATINEAIAKARQKIGMGTDDGTLNKVALSIYKTLRSSTGATSEENVRFKATQILNKSTEALNATIKKWKEVKPTVDVDSAEKTDRQINYVVEHFKKLKEVVESTKYTGMAYVVYLLRFLIDKRIDGSEETT